MINLNIYKMSQRQLKRYCIDTLEVLGYRVHDGDGWLVAEYVGGESGNVGLVAHLDTVHKQTPKIVSKDGRISAPTTGLGADDRAGVDMILQLVEQGFTPTIYLFEDEEIGGVGVGKAIHDKWFNRLNHIHDQIELLIELDRYGASDAAIYEPQSIELEEFMLSFGYRMCWGSYTDIATLGPHLKKASVNLSIGYYNQHTKSEYLVKSEWRSTFFKVWDMLDAMEGMKFPYVGDRAYTDSYLFQSVEWDEEGWDYDEEQEILDKILFGEAE